MTVYIRQNVSYEVLIDKKWTKLITRKNNTQYVMHQMVYQTVLNITKVIA